jgi:phage tail sheath gpL-like
MAFTEIPSNNLVPGIFGEFDKSAAVTGTPEKPFTALAIGTVESTYTANAEKKYTITNVQEAVAAFGPGPLTMMCAQFLARNKRARLRAIGLTEDAGGTAAAGSLAFTGTATAAGTVYVRINGELITAAVAVGDTATNVASAVSTAIFGFIAFGANFWRVPAVPSPSTGTVTITAYSKGTWGNDMTLSLNAAQGEALPAGITCVVTDFTGGATDPDIADAIAVFGDETFDTIITEYNDATNLGTLQAEIESRWTALDARDGLAFCGAAGTVGDVNTLVSSRNNQYETVIPSSDSPSCPWEWAAQAAAAEATLLDSALVGSPAYGIALPGVLPPADPFDMTERQTLLAAGVSTTLNDASGRVVIERLVTTYTTDAVTNTPDPTYRALATMRVLSYLRWSWKTRLVLKGYLGRKLANDGAQYDPSANVITPSTLRGEALSWYGEMERKGLVDQREEFEAALTATINSGDPTRVDLLLSPQIVNELITVAAKFQFVL